MLQVDTISNEGSSFLDRMRHSSAYQLVQQIKQFLTMFTQTEGPPDEYSDLFQQFLEVQRTSTAQIVLSHLEHS